MTKEDYTRQILQLAFRTNSDALYQPAKRVVANVFTVIYDVLDDAGYEKLDQLLRKSFPEYYLSDGRTRINMNHYKMETNRGGQFLKQMSQEEIADLYKPKQ